MKKTNKKGFTIVELVIVIAVIAVLAAVLIPTFVKLIRKSKVNNDTQLIRNLNTALEADKVDNTHSTMTDALKAAEAYGYDVSKINASATNNEILWDSENDVFCYINDGEIEYLPDSVDNNKKLSAESNKLWKIYNGEVPDANHQTYSIYLGSAAAANSINNGTVKVGFDVGEQNIDTITYAHSGAAQSVVIRTNSVSTTLTINAESDTIHHYDTLGALNIIKANTASYHENGKVSYAEIAYGRIVLETGSKVEEIHVNKKTDSSFDTVIIANNGGAEELPQRITRDAVTVASETLVVKVESNGSSENVYVYADGATGTKGSTQKITEGENKQNENVNSDLGQLVLDNGAEADKAQTLEEKADAKDEIASEAVSTVFENQEGNGDYVARIGQTGYMTLQSAVEAAVDGNTIALLKDIVFSPSEYLLINKDITLNLGGKTISGAKDPMIVIGASVANYQPASNKLTHTGHLTIKGEGTITSSNWDMICVFPDAVLDVYSGSFIGMQCPFFISGGTLNTYGGYFRSNALYNSATTSYANYIVQVKNAGFANIYAGEFFTPEYGCYGVYLDNASVCNFGSETGDGPVFNTWRPCIASNGSESHAVLANVYSGTYHAYRSDNKTGENSVIQLANNTSETQTLNVCGGTFEQTGSNENRCIFNVRYGGTINVNISGGKFIATSPSRLFNGVGSSTWPTNDNVHITVANNAISTPQNVKVYNTSNVYQSERDFELLAE